MGEEDKRLLLRIDRNPERMAGQPVIKGTRLTVSHILRLLGHGATTEEILDEYAGLTEEDIRACRLYAKEKNNTP